MENYEENKIKSIVDDLCKECYEDDVGLWEIIGEIKLEWGEREDLIEMVLSIVSRLLDNPIVAETFEQDGKWHVWEGPKEDLLARIRKEWEDLGREPNIGDVAYFTAVERLK